ncbi:MAG: DUF1214 domain-containing protein [Bryobacteraceae bacterium]|jgi:hypothetical protein
MDSLGAASYTNPESNSDGSIDIYFGPQPRQAKEKNWIQTISSKGSPFSASTVRWSVLRPDMEA